MLDCVYVCAVCFNHNRGYLIALSVCLCLSVSLQCYCGARLALLNEKLFHECSAAFHSLSNLCAFAEGCFFIKKVVCTVIITPHFSTAVGGAGAHSIRTLPGPISRNRSGGLAIDHRHSVGRFMLRLQRAWG